MSEPRKNHLSIDGGQVKEDEHVDSYKPIPDSDAVEFRSSKASLHKSKDKVDEAEEKLLEKEAEAKITTRVDMADAKYVVGDHRNGDAKIELDANKRQFSGLTKEELMQYADDPFWVRLRWTMFVLFWALWLCMLAGAVAIIVQAPKCAPPLPKTWFEKGPLVESELGFQDLEPSLAQLKAGGAAGVFASAMCGDNAYQVLEAPECLEKFKRLVVKAKEHGVRVIVDLVANFVPTSHQWFQLSENRSAGFEDYFLWRDGKGYDAANKAILPNNWVAVTDEPAWSFSAARGQHYLHQQGAGKADLNFFNPTVVAKFEDVLNTWMKAGAAGVRLHHARTLLVNMSFPDEIPAGEKSGLSAAHAQYAFWRHQHAADQPALDLLLGRWSAAVAAAAADSVFTIAESGAHSELYLLARNSTGLRPAAAAPVDADAAPAAVAHNVNRRLRRWPLLQLKSSSAGSELAAFALLLPAAPVVTLGQLEEDANTTASESLSRVLSLREDATVEFGNWSVQAVPALNSSHQLLAVARWKAGHTGYVGVWNSGTSALQADLSQLPALPAALTVHRASPAVHQLTGYTSNQGVAANNVTVPAASALVLSFVPVSVAEK